MEIELFDRHTMVFGLKHAGKSNWLAHVMSQDLYRNSLVYDLCREHDHGGVNRVVPENRKGDAAKEEFTEFIEALVTANDRDLRPDLIIAEEVSRYAPNSGGAPDSLLDLIDLNRHYGVGFLGCARRPAQVDTDLVELADQLIIFALRGKNDVKRLNSEASGLGDAAQKLKPYEYLVVDGMREWERHAPVPEYDTTGRL